MNKPTRCGYIAIIGSPNVGKSTLLNQLLGQKVSITSRKPQTTRHRILGIWTEQDVQAIFIDTPGLNLSPKNLMNKIMLHTTLEALRDVDVIIFMVDAKGWTKEDDFFVKKLTGIKTPIVLVINKIDRLKNKNDLLPLIQNWNEKFQRPPQAIIPLSAKSGENVQTLVPTLIPFLPEGPHLFSADEFTDRSARFLAAEIIREKLMRLFGQEVPHALSVEIEEFKEVNEVLHVHAIIWVEREGQKVIIIGSKGEALKRVGEKARKDLEFQWEKKVYLKLWVKVKKGWTNDERALHRLGYA